jgi:hypothetical protein
MRILFLQMDKGPGDLNEALEKLVVFVATFQPEIFQDVVRLVVMLLVEARKIALVAGIQRQGRIRPELLDKG